MREIIAIGVVIGPIALLCLIVWALSNGETFFGVVGSLVLLSVVVAADVKGAHYGWGYQMMAWDTIFTVISCFVVAFAGEASSKRSY